MSGPGIEDQLRDLARLAVDVAQLLPARIDHLQIHHLGQGTALQQQVLEQIQPVQEDGVLARQGQRARQAAGEVVDAGARARGLLLDGVGAQQRQAQEQGPRHPQHQLRAEATRQQALWRHGPPDGVSRSTYLSRRMASSGW